MPITIVTIVGRTLLALLFILAGAAKSPVRNPSSITWPRTIFQARCCHW